VPTGGVLVGFRYTARGIVMRKRGRSERGAAAVEFALILPLFIMVIFGLIQFGFYFWTAETANSSAREVARRMAVGDCWDSGGRQTFASGHAPRITALSVSPDITALSAGDKFTVEVIADGDLLGLLPLPNGGDITRNYVARLEYEVNSGTCAS